MEQKKNKIGIRKITQIGLLAAIAALLMWFELPLPFAPPFYKIDLGDVPAMIGTFSMGPVAGVLIQLVKILLKLIMKSSTTLGIGDVASFMIGCAFCVPAGLTYRKKKSRTGAFIGMALGTVVMTAFGAFLNAFVLLPTYAKAFEVPMEELISLGTAVNANITNLSSFVMLAVVPFNLVKGIIVSSVVLLIYKKVRVLLRTQG
jgi:Predicted membrane protein